MPDENEVNDAVAHTAEAGGSTISRMESLLESFSGTLTNLVNNTGRIAEHLAELRVLHAAEDVPAAAREGVNDSIDTVGAAGNVGAKAVDVPLAATEDAIHDTAEVAREADKDVKQARKKLFSKKRRHYE